MRRNGARKGSVQLGCAFGGADDVDVVQVRCQQLPITQVGSRLNECMVLPQCIQGGGKWVTLFDPFPLGDLVVLAKVVPPMILGGVPIHGTGERDQLRDMLAKGREHGVARDAIVCSPAIDGYDGGSGIQVDCCAQRAGQGIHAGTRLEGELIGPGCGVDAVCVLACESAAGETAQGVPGADAANASARFGKGREPGLRQGSQDRFGGLGIGQLGKSGGQQGECFGVVEEHFKVIGGEARQAGCRSALGCAEGLGDLVRGEGKGEGRGKMRQVVRKGSQGVGGSPGRIGQGVQRRLGSRCQGGCCEGGARTGQIAFAYLPACALAAANGSSILRGGCLRRGWPGSSARLVGGCEHVFPISGQKRCDSLQQHLAPRPFGRLVEQQFGGEQKEAPTSVALLRGGPLGANLAEGQEQGPGGCGGKEAREGPDGGDGGRDLGRKVNGVEPRPRGWRDG